MEKQSDLGENIERERADNTRLREQALKFKKHAEKKDKELRFLREELSIFNDHKEAKMPAD